jgi:hypothetical protein
MSLQAHWTILAKTQYERVTVDRRHSWGWEAEAGKAHQIPCVPSYGILTWS